MDDRDLHDWAIIILGIGCVLFIMLGGLSFIADRMQRTHEPCTLACEK